jgi:DNA-binding transcriptional ArsR family regulator
MAKKRKKKNKAKEREGKLRQVMDPGLAQVLSHPYRSHTLMTLGDRIVSPKGIADELEINPRDLSYHTKVLKGMEMIRLVSRKKRRGAYEHFYELTMPLLHFDDHDWAQIPQPIRTSFSASLLRIGMDDAVEALRAGTFNARDSHQSRTPMILDERGFNRLTKLMNDTLQKMLEIREESVKDLEKTGGQGIPIEVLMLGFETAAGVKDNPAREAGGDA